MLESVGKKLEQARLQKKLSVEEVAFATKIRPERILDLEKDEYRHFPNLTYAKGFLTLYAKFLGVNVAEYTASLGKANPVGVSDYEYLSHDPETHSARKEPVRGRPLGSLVLFALLLLVGVLGFYLLIGYQRLGQGITNEAAPTATASPTPVQAPVTQAVQPEAPVAPTPEAVPPGNDSTVEVRRAEPVAVPQPTPQMELVIEPLRKTWLRLQKDDLQAAPVFEGFVDRKTGPITFQGTRFWVSVAEKSAVRITRGGVAVAEDDPLVIVQ